MLITSRDNRAIKYATSLLNRKGRNREARFLVEGVKQVSEALMYPDVVETVFLREDIPRTSVQGLTEYSGPILSVAKKLEKVLSNTETSQGVWCICHKPALADWVSVSQGRFVLLLAGIQDPGNLGTMLRTAASVGVEAVLLTPNTIDPFNPKVVRSAAGAILRIPLLTDISTEELKQLKNLGFYLAACDPRGNESLFQVDLTGKMIFVVGNEGSGIPLEIMSLTDYRIRIPLQPGMESLNAAVACGIVLYESFRQRLID